MLRRKRLKMFLAVLAVTTCLYVYSYVDLRTSRNEGQGPGRRLHIVRITNEDISKLGGGAQPPDLPPSFFYPQASLPTAIPPPSPLHAVPFRTLPQQPDARSEGNFLYDASDVSYKPPFLANTRGLVKNVVPPPRVSQPDEPRIPEPIDSLDQNSVDGENYPVIAPENVEASDEDTRSVYTKEKEVIALANLGPIPKNKRKKLEMYLSHLSSDQFNEVYRNIVGYENELNDDNKLDILSHHKNGLDEDNVRDKVSAPLHLMLPGRAFGLTNDTRSQARRGCVNGCVGHKSAGILRGYSARVKIESLTLPPDWTSTPEVEERLQRRQRHVKEVCHKHELDVPSANNSVNAWEFFISDKFNLVWCSVFKAASSTWIYNFNVLAGYSENFLLKAKDTPITLARKKYPRPSVEELTQFMNKTAQPLSFLIARHPLHRLVSAYRDKLLSGHRYYSKLARKIVSEYPELGRGSQETAGGGLAGDHKPRSPLSNRVKLSRKLVVPTFPQLVQYLIDAHKRGEAFDEHWAPIDKFCTPCLFQFDVIAKLETIDEDSNYVIFKSGIENYIRPKRINRNRNAPTDEVADSFLCQLSTDMMKSLIDIYKIDLELFDYEYDHYLNCTTREVRLGRISKVR